ARARDDRERDDHADHRPARVRPDPRADPGRPGGRDRDARHTGLQADLLPRPLRLRRSVRADPHRADRRARADPALLPAHERAAGLRGLQRYPSRTLLRGLALVLAAVLYCLPFYLVISIALETTAQTYRTPLSFPSPPHPGNFSTAWRAGGHGGLDH